MIRSIIIVVFVLATGCASGPHAEAPPTALDLQRIDMLTAFDEEATEVIADMKFDSRDAAVRAFADKVSHTHRAQSDKLRRWRARHFPEAAPTDAPPPPCVAAYSSQPRHAHPATDISLLARFVQHRECAIALADELRHKTRNPSVKQLAEESVASFRAEIDEARGMRPSP